MKYVASLATPTNSFTLGIEGGTLNFNDRNPSNEVSVEIKEYLETYIGVDNKPLFVFERVVDDVEETSPTDEDTEDIKTTIGKPQKASRIIKKAVEE